MKLEDVKRGHHYWHPNFGPVIAVAPDPDDGALWVVRLTASPDDNIMDYRGTEADPLVPAGLRHD